MRLALLISACLLLAGCRSSRVETTAGPEVETPVDVIAFGSCAAQDRPQPIWDAVVARRPDLFLFIGDNIYADTEDMAVMRAKYEQLGAQPGFRRLRETTPVLAVWDDHDYGVNDGGAEYPKRAESQQEFLRFFEVPASREPWRRPGVYDAYVFGPPGRRVQIILLDARYFRSPLRRWPEGNRRTPGPYAPNDEPDATVLGEAQWRWLEEQLRRPAEVRLIASGIQVVPEEHGWEMWANFPRERDRLFRLVRDTGAKGVVFLSGDRHLAEISRLPADAPNGAGYPLYDVTASSLNRPSGAGTLEANRFRVNPENYRPINFGLLTIDWSRPDPLLRLEIRDERGNAVLGHDVRLDELR